MTNNPWWYYQKIKKLFNSKSKYLKIRSVKYDDKKDGFFLLGVLLYRHQPKINHYPKNENFISL